MLRACRFASRQRCFSTIHNPQSSGFDVKHNTLVFAEQTVFAGTNALLPLAEALTAHNYKKLLIVSDAGVAGTGIVQKVQETLWQYGHKSESYLKCQPNPGVTDVAEIAEKFLEHGSDCVVAVGGGGPMDAAKAAMALVGKQRATSSFHISRDAGDFITVTCRGFSSNMSKEALEAIPPMVAVPTTAGTGSDGGKSSVIVDSHGIKTVFGNPRLMPKYAALVPQLTENLPSKLSIHTGVDALLHCLEPLFCPTKIMIERDGMTHEEIARCDSFSRAGMKLVHRYLPLVVKNPHDLEARLHMQIAALYGAKAFRKGDLGGVHAAAHALGAKYHLHHGECIARMTVPVLQYNETHADLPTEAVMAAEEVRKIFKGQETMYQSVESFLRQFKLPLGVGDLVEFTEDLEFLAEVASQDACQTNPIPLSKSDYVTIFEMASRIDTHA